MGTPFIVYALPRSRTAWLSRALTYGDWTCHHEVAITMRDFPDVTAFFRQPNTGAAETAAALGWRLLHHHLPDLKAVVICRPIDEVVPAMIAAGRPFVSYDETRLRSIMERSRRALDEISAQPGVLTIDYADLNREEAFAAIFEHCLPYKHSGVWWDMWHPVNVQAEVKPYVTYYHQNKDAVERFKRTCKVELARLVRAGLIGRKGVAHAVN